MWISLSWSSQAALVHANDDLAQKLSNLTAQIINVFCKLLKLSGMHHILKCKPKCKAKETKP